MGLLEDYKKHTEQRATLGVPPLALDSKQTADLVEILKSNPDDYALGLFENNIKGGVDDSAYVKAAFLNDVVQGKATCSVISKVKAIEILGKMGGGFNVNPLVEGLKIDGEVAGSSA